MESYRQGGRRARGGRRFLLALVTAWASMACGRTTLREAHEVNGQVYYTETTAPGVSESLFHGVTHDCLGGVRADERALSLVPTRTGCSRDSFVVSYTADGIHRVEACDEVWRIRCTKPSTASGTSGPLSCSTDCSVDDHFVVSK